ncbi:acyltransferase family protein [Methylobacterium sp. J-068]|uniref:acyltransferase family protein n=1 Tax=Methylobacterium sp. J-068 TaxID=2836649 RepID=UPI001FBBBD21|nr:acyltransferase family protein [Methylobacterium sp. J-068]MCJ2035715.1 acyltransferase [Methylobacterium sp. J-068]
MVYRPDIDGLRALAVLVVLAFHAGMPALSGGFVGVDVFLVISGYVITAKILADVEAGHFTVAGFYERRIRRILPMLAATLLGTALAAPLLLPAPALADLARSIAASAGFVSNLYFWKSSSYFDVAAQTRPLLHTWSLSLEEQFYLFIPLLLPVLLRRPHGRSRRPAAAILLAGALASFALSLWLTPRAPTTSFYLLPTRAWELLLGGLLAFLRPGLVPARAPREGLAAAGLALILVPMLSYDEATPFPGLGAVPPCLGAALIILAGASGPSRVGTLLAARPCVAVGLASYALYMVHWPLIVLTRYALLRDPTGLETVALMAACGLLAYAGRRWIETPFRYPARPVPRTVLFRRTGAALMASAALGLAVGAWARGADPAATSLAALEREAWRGGRCFLENQDPSAWAGEACRLATGTGRTALLWGDSFAAHYMPGLARNAGALSHDILQYTAAGCPPLLAYRSRAHPDCAAFNARLPEVIRAHGVDHVVLAARWDLVPPRALASLPDTLARLRVAGVSVSLIGPSPLFAFDVALLGARGAGTRNDGSAAWFARSGHREAETLRALAPGAGLIDPEAYFCTPPLCRYRAEGTDLFVDYGHFSAAGSDRAVRAYFPLLRPLHAALAP